jgi:hypothetical protein
MPVLECSCGMVMSISTATPRNKCIRCGGIEFRELERFQAVARATGFASQVRNTIGGNELILSPLAMAGTAGSSIVAGCSLWPAREDCVNGI